jgi:Fic family protein
MTHYNWQQDDWPRFQYDLKSIQETLIAIAEKSGVISGKLSHLSDELKMEAQINLMVEEAANTSEIEGEFISRIDIRSSIKNKLQLNPEKIHVQDKRAKGIVDLMFSVRQTFKKPLSENQLFDWHLQLFVGTVNPNLRVGYWRTDEEPMQIVSSRRGKWIVHFEAPPAKSVPEEMTQFIRWFNETTPGKSRPIHYAAVRAAIAHLYFESIHPFEDGNGRIGRALAEKALSQGFGFPVLLSLSQEIEAHKKSYYDALHAASKSNEISEWIDYFVNLVLRAQMNAEKQINFIFKKSVFFDRYQNQLNDRQIKVLKRMMDAGIKGFEGGMSARKYMKIADTSKATATRDMHYLVEIDIFRAIGSGRSVRYELNLGE